MPAYQQPSKDVAYQNQARSLYPGDNSHQRLHQEQQRRNRQNEQDHNPYGDREDENAYWENNHSRVALNEGGALNGDAAYNHQQPDTSGYPPAQRRKKETRKEKEGYGVPLPTLNKQPDRSPSSNANSERGKVISNAPVVDMQEFFDEIGSLRSALQELQSQIAYLDQLHTRNLTGQQTEELAHELDRASSATRKLTNQLRKRVKGLQETTRIRTHGQAETDRQTRKVQIAAIRERYACIHSHNTQAASATLAVGPIKRADIGVFPSGSSRSSRATSRWR